MIFIYTTISNFYIENDFNKLLLKNVPQLKERYLPSPIMPFRFMRMIYGNIEQENTIKYRREIIVDHHSEKIALDWIDTSDNQK